MLDKILSFWDWFQENSDNLKSNPIDYSLIKSLDSQIHQINPNISWEIGPGLNADSFFAISPNLNVNLIELTSEIISQAPKCNGWEFYPAKPPKRWDLRWVMKTDEMGDIEIDASEWQYVLFQFEDNTYGLDVKVKDSKDMSYDSKYEAAEFAILSIIGEYQYLKYIGDLRIVDEFDDDLLDRANSLKDLKKHLLREELSKN